LTIAVLQQQGMVTAGPSVGFVLLGTLVLFVSPVGWWLLLFEPAVLAGSLLALVILLLAAPKG